MGKRILFITESYYDSPSPNGNCVRILSDELIKSGHNVSVLTLKNQSAKRDSVIDGVKVFRVNTYAEWRVLFTKKIPNIAKRILSKLCKEFKNIYIPLHPLRSPFVLTSLVNKAKRIVKEQNIDTVIGVYRDFETAYAAVLLKKKYPDIKLCIYTLDSMSGGVCSNRLVKPETHVKKCNKWELEFLKHCDKFCIMKSHTALFENQRYSPYRDKIVALDVPNLLIPENRKSSQKSDENLNFVFTGMLSETNADCRFFLEVFKKISEKMNAAFNIYGGISDGILKAIEKTGLYNNRICFHGRVTQEELKKIREEADVFLNFGNEHPCGIPCKLFEYIPMGKVILSFYKIEEDASTAYLARYPKALLLKQNAGLEEAYAQRFIDFWNEKNEEEISLDYIVKEFYDNTPEAFLDMIEKM